MDVQADQWVVSDKAAARQRRRENASLWALHHEKLAEQVEAEAQERAAMHRQKAQGFRDMLANNTIPEPSVLATRDPWQ